MVEVRAAQRIFGPEESAYDCFQKNHVARFPLLLDQLEKGRPLNNNS